MLMQMLQARPSHYCHSHVPSTDATPTYAAGGRDKHLFLPNIDLQLTGKLSVPEISNVSYIANDDNYTSCSRYQPQICMFP